MYLIALFGMLMMLLSALMVINPQYWSQAIVAFSQKRYFHPFEILSRFGFGVIFIVFSDSTLHPNMMLAIGYLLIAVSVGLLLTPPQKHRQFALWAAQKFKPIFRPAGIISFLFGLFIVYLAI